MTPKLIRLLDDSGTEPELRQALDELAHQDVLYDPIEGLERFREGIPVPSPVAPATGKLVRAPRGWLGAGVVGASVAAVAVVLLRSPPEPSPQSPILTEPIVAPTASAQTLPLEIPELLDLPPPDHREPAEHTLSVPPPSPPRAPTSTGPRSSKPASPSAESIAEEVWHLSELRRVAGEDPAAAVRLADEGHRRFAGGALYQEREAVAISALARAGRAGEARARGERYLARFPKNPFGDQVRRAAGIEP